MINLFINRKPLAQSRPRVTFKYGKTWAYEPANVRKEKQAIAIIAKQYMIKHKLKPITNPFWMTIEYELPIPKCWSKSKIQAANNREIFPCGNRNDWDNLGKLTSDALNKICYSDDSLCCEARISKYYCIDLPHTKISIDEIGANYANES